MIKTFSKVWIVVGVLILLTLVYLGACFLSPASYLFSSEVKIEGPYKMAYITINDIKEWSKWVSWGKDDPEFKMQKGGREYYIGANFSFESKKLGKGHLELKESFFDSLVTARLKADKLPSDLFLSWQIVPEGKKSLYVKLNARTPGRINFLQRGLYFGMKSKLDQLLQADLEGIKNYIEKLVQTDFGIQKTPFTERHYFGIMDVVVNAKIPQFYAKNLPKVYQFLDSIGVTPSGPPAGLIFGWTAKTGQLYLLAALPVDKALPNYRGWTSYTIKPTECLKLENYGSYATLKNAHAKLSYLMDNSPYILGIPIVEEYVTSPSQEPDTSKWLTNLYYLFDNTGSYSKTVERKATLEDVIKMEEAQRREKLKNLIQTEF